MAHRGLRGPAKAARYVLFAATSALVVTGVWRAQPVVAQAPAPVTAAATSSAGVLKNYCATCHSDRAKAGGLVIDPAALTNVGAGAERWEKVVRKLRAQSMPPPGAPRPDAASYERVATF